MATILTPSDLVGLSGRVAIDFETTGLDAYRDRSLGLGIYAPDDAGLVGFVPTPAARDLDQLREVMASWSPGTWVMAHNVKFELAYLKLPWEVASRLRWYDTQVAEHLLNEDRTLSLEACEARRLGSHSKKGYLTEAAPYGGIKRIADWPESLVAEYCVNDCRLTYELAVRQSHRLRAERLDDLFRTLSEYVLNLHAMEHHGVALDPEALSAMEARIERLLSEGVPRLQGELAKLGLPPVNYRSAPQLSKLIYQDLGVPWPELPPELANSPKAAKYNSTRTDQHFLEKIEHPIVKLISQLKKVSTIAGYVKSYRELALPEDGLLVLHPSFNPTGTVTGRLSCSSPNLQQVSAKPVGQGLSEDGQGLLLRSIFRARPGRVLVSIDYSQMEVVAFAILSQEPLMLELVRNGGDMHEQVAALLFGKYTPERRKAVKNLNFGLLYGLGMAGMAEMMGVEIAEAQRLMDLYMARFKRVRPFLAKVEDQLRQHGYVRYWSGRKRRIRESSLFYRGVNSVVQGGSADILAVAANRVSAYLRDSGAGDIVALIHDEVLMELDADSYLEHLPEVVDRMRVKDLLGTPFNVNVEVSTHWGVNAQKLDVREGRVSLPARQSVGLAP